MFVNRLRSKLDAKLFKGIDIHLGKHDGGVYLTVGKFWKLGQRLFCIGIGGCADGKGNQHFVSVQTRIMASQIPGL